jgi:hypothetical protein
MSHHTIARNYFTFTHFDALQLADCPALALVPAQELARAQRAVCESGTCPDYDRL